MKILVIGDGGWGTALSILLNNKGHNVTLWSYSPEYADVLRKKRENVKFLKGISIPGKIKITSELKRKDIFDLVLFAVPCGYLSSVAEKFRDFPFGKIVSATKGIENGSLRRPSEILKSYYKRASIAVLSGPSISGEVAKGFPAALVLAGKGLFREEAQKALSTDRFRVYTSGDITGVELGGAVKNVVAIAAGISDGLGFGTNTKAAILTRGLAEIVRLGDTLGAKEDTFKGLSGIGDLATTCMSSNSRNRWFGEQLGLGRKIQDILGETEMAVEGVLTSRSVNELAVKHSVDMPITRKIYEIIYEGKDPKRAVFELMTRELKSE
ncbi:MAG: NAD(P)-dependent glycerol-3-phosphate dehydrogenase [Candidatus Omnitrophica bacterium]|nr:NAD(P)-dependent glycerol-3-phosphate dehydrogenase [Candidatus Omnitrophota bacterium]